MVQYLIKIFVTSIIIVAISEAAKRSLFFAGIIASLPLTSILAMIWLYSDTKDLGQVSNLSTTIFWMVLPSLGFFLAFPLLVKWGASFQVALVGSILCLIASYTLYVGVLAKFGISL